MRNLSTFLSFVVLLIVGMGVPALAQTATAVTVYDLGTAEVNDPELDLDITAPLQGAIALPNTEAPAPLVLVLHGRHAMCGVDIAVYPCELGEEIRYDLGFSYLLEALAEAGYAAVALNINPTLTEAYGRGDVDTRTAQLVDLHLNALAAAVAGQSSDFGVAVTGRIDLSRVALIGHSSGGGAALHITRNSDYPIDGLLLIAAAYNALGPERLQRSGEELYAYYGTPSDVAVATILPDCDGDQIYFWSQVAYEAARLDPERSVFAASVRVFAANHNHFNAAVDRGDRRFGYPPCFAETTDIMPRGDQEQFLIDYATAFLSAIWGEITPPAFDASLPAPENLFGQRVETSLSLPPAQRRAIILPQTDDERSVNLLGGTVHASERAGVMFCPPGGTCLSGITTMGRFGFLRLSFGPRATFEFEVPEAYTDLSVFDALHLRAAYDYTSTLNVPETSVTFSIVLADATGAQSEVILSDMAFQMIPPPAEFYAYDPFALYPMSIRIPLREFSGVDLSAITHITVRAGDVSGTLLLADLELLSLGD